MNNLNDLLNLLEDSRSHIFESVPHIYLDQRILVYKKPKEPFKITLRDDTPWDKIEWQEVASKDIISGLSESKYNIDVFHSIVLDHLLTERYSMEKRLEDIEKVIDAKTINKFDERMDNFFKTMEEVIIKIMKKSKFKVISND